jgi:LmbE family N-acetylglucosaminyl deacetylase
MNDSYDVIYLSPHLDDAALSCGGQIYELTTEGKTVLVVTIMAGDPISIPPSQYAQSLHQRWQLQSDVVRARRAEDVAACNVLGADWQHWDFLDCIYRVNPVTERPFYTADEDIFGEIDPAESDLVTALAGKMAQLPASNQVLAPLTLGHHVDHQLTRQAAECCFSAVSLYYYEDYPYARQFSAEQFIAQETGNWQAKVVKLTESGVAARIHAIKCFESQISSFFKDEEDLEEQITFFIKTAGGEKVWATVQD